MKKWYSLTNREHVIIFLLVLDLFFWIISLNIQSFRGHLILFVFGMAAFAAAIWQLTIYLINHYRLRNAKKWRL